MKLRNEQRVETVNPETGELQTIITAKEYSTRVKTDEFYMTFIDYVSPMFKLKSENARKLLVWLCCHAEWNTGEVNLTAADRVIISEELNICNNTITNNLQQLKKLNLISGEKGKFIINPQIFWKGDTKTRGQLLKDGEIRIKFSIE